MADTLQQIATRVRENFRTRFGAEPRVFAAPGRINLIGEHTDYSGGLVMPAAIDRWTVMAAAPNGTQNITVHAAAFEAEMTARLEALTPQKTWIDYVAGPAWVLHEEGVPVKGADLWIQSTVPMGSGVSSSAALEVATLRALAALADRNVSGPETAQWARRAENDFVGVPCGIMDQFASANGVAGHVLLLDCRTLQCSPYPLPPDMAFVLINSMVRHALVEGHYRERRDDCERAARALGVECLGVLREYDLAECLPRLPPREAQRCRHVVTENARVEAAAAALVQGNMIALGQLLNRSHASLRDDMQTSVTEVDQLAEMAQATAGVFGARIMGGGFGGCVIALTRADEAERIAASIGEQFASTTGLSPVTHVCHAVDGAREVFA